LSSGNGSAGASPYPDRRKPAQGVHIDLGQPTIVFVTACTKDRARWLACEEAHRLLAEVWHRADAWLVGNYVLMPDHLHLFAAPRDLHFTIERWMTFWKSQFSKAHRHADWVWQTSAFHHRLRRDESYAQKWLYVQENPVRAGLAKEIGQWPFQGTIHELRW
jgi:putative transposase